MELELRILGPLEASLDGEPIRLGGAKQQTVLAGLLVNANRVVSVDRLVQWTWGESADDRNAATLQVYVSNLRKLLSSASAERGRAVVETQRPGYIAMVQNSELDLLKFEELRQQGAGELADGDATAAVGSLRAAVGLWRGEPLAGLPVAFDELGDLGRIAAGHLPVIGLIAQAELAAGHHANIVDELQGWVAEHPFDEQLLGSLMLALYRCGRQTEALRVFGEGRNRLAEEIGIDPSKQLRDLESKILAQDASLDFGRSSGGTRRELVEDDSSSTVMRSSVVVHPAHLEIDGAVVPLDRAVTTIGRRADRTVVILDPGASRDHAEIRRGYDGYQLRDAGSANGTSVNGTKVHDHWLADGDVIAIGDIELSFHHD